MRPAICIQTFTLPDQTGIQPGIALVKVPERTLTSNRRGHPLRAGAGMLQRYLWKLLPKPQRAFLLGHLALDFIGYQEHLERDFCLVCEHLGLKTPLPHVNCSRQRRPLPAREFCTLRTQRLVRRVYERDYEMLAYE
jgi:hypothetical protein